MFMGKKAFITGITGQDGSYLAEHLLNLGYEVHGLVRRVAFEVPERRFARIKHILKDIILHSGNVENYSSVLQIISKHNFDECYHLAAQSFVSESFEDSFSTMRININGTHYVLAALQNFQPQCRFYFAGSSEMFGKVRETPQKETTPFYPRSPYGISKVTGFELTRNYREAYNMFCCSGILFNHEGPRRGVEFVTRKITNAVARIKLGFESELRLGNIEVQRDWGHAADYIKAMHMMLQQPSADDYVISSGETHSVKEFCELAFSCVGLDYQDYVVIDKQFYRMAEVDLLVGDSTKAKTVLGWQPEYKFRALIEEMVLKDLELVSSMHL